MVTLLQVSLVLPRVVEGATSEGAIPWTRAVARRAQASRGDCLVAAGALLAGGFTPDAAELLTLLNRTGVVQGSDSTRLESPATRGYASLLFCRALGEKAGLLGHLFTGSEHLAYRHLRALGFVPAGGAWASMSGPELVSLLALARKHARQKAQRESKPSAPGSDEPGGNR